MTQAASNRMDRRSFRWRRVSRALIQAARTRVVPSRICRMDPARLREIENKLSVPEDKVSITAATSAFCALRVDELKRLSASVGRI